MLEFTCWYYAVEKNNDSNNHFPNNLNILRMYIWYVPVSPYKALIPQDQKLILAPTLPLLL